MSIENNRWDCLGEYRYMVTTGEFNWGPYDTLGETFLVAGELVQQGLGVHIYPVPKLVPSGVPAPHQGPAV